MRAVFLGVALVVCQVVLATNRTWTGLEENGLLDSAGNWDPADTPAAADNLSVTTVGASTNVFRIDGDLTVRTLTFAQGEQASGEVAIDLSGRTLKVNDGAPASVTSPALNLPLALAAFSNGSLQVNKMVLGDGRTTAKATFADMSVYASSLYVQAWTAKATQWSEFEFFRCAVTNLPVFAQNTSVLLDGCEIYFAHANGVTMAGENSWLHLTNKSKLTGDNHGLGYMSALANTHIVIDGGSSVACPIQTTSGHDNVIAATNATLTGSIGMHGSNDTFRAHNVTMSGNLSLKYNDNLYAQHSRAVFSGGESAYSRAGLAFAGKNNVIEFADGCTNTVSTSTILDWEGSNNTFRVGEQALVRLSYSRTSAPASLRDCRVEIKKGGRLVSSAQQEFFGQRMGLVLDGGCLDCMYARVGTGTNSNGCFVELNGDDARLFATNGQWASFSIGRASASEPMRISFTPGNSGFHDEVPIVAQTDVSMATNTLVEIDARKCFAGKTGLLRLPLIKSNGGMGRKINLTDAQLETLTANGSFKPAGGRLVIDNKVLYYELEKNPGLMLILR